MIVRRTISGASTGAAVCALFALLVRDRKVRPMTASEQHAWNVEASKEVAFIVGVGAMIGLVSSLIEMAFRGLTGILFMKSRKEKS
jgi:hypothetical protein